MRRVTEHRITRWWWIRHAPVTENHGRVYGSSDPAADVSDRAGFEMLASQLPPDAVWVRSHLKRTHQTIEALAETGVRVSDPVLVEPHLGEQNFGAWQGLTWEEVAARQDGVPSHKFWLAPAAHRPPDGESFHEVTERVHAVIARLTEAHAGRDIVAVAHGGSIRAALALALDLDPDLALGFATENLSTTRIDHVDGPGLGGAWRVGFVNARVGVAGGRAMMIDRRQEN